MKIFSISEMWARLLMSLWERSKVTPTRFIYPSSNTADIEPDSLLRARSFGQLDQVILSPHVVSDELIIVR